MSNNDNHIEVQKDDYTKFNPPTKMMRLEHLNLKMIKELMKSDKYKDIIKVDDIYGVLFVDTSSKMTYSAFNRNRNYKLLSKQLRPIKDDHRLYQLMGDATSLDYYDRMIVMFDAEYLDIDLLKVPDAKPYEQYPYLVIRVNMDKW